MSIEVIPQTIQVAEVIPARLVLPLVEHPRGSDRFYQKRIRRGRGRSPRCHHGKRINDISHGCRGGISGSSSFIRSSFTELFNKSFH